MIAAAFAAVALISAPATQAVPPEAVADLQCLGVLNILMDNSDMAELTRKELVGSMMYYLGRLEGRDPHTDWVKSMEQYMRTTPFEEIDSQNRRCGEELSAKGRSLQSLLSQ